MNLHDILLSVQYVAVAVLFIEICIVFLRWKNTIHSYLFLALISLFISNMGYLFEMRARTEEAYISAIKFSYAGRVWIIFAFFLFCARMCRVKIPWGVTAILMTTLIGVYMAVLTIGSNGLYYSDYGFVPDPVFPMFYHSNGIIHDLFMVVNGIMVAVAMVWVIREYRIEKSGASKRRLMLLILAFGVQAISFIMQATGFLGISKYYDLTMPGALLGSLFMLVGILGFDLMGTREIARDFAIDRISEGILAVDNAGRIKYFNEPLAKIYPEFSAFYGNGSVQKTSGPVYTPYDILSIIEKAVKDGETIKAGDRIFSVEENELQYKGESYGKLYALVDDTEHYRYMEELQKQRDIADNANEAKSRFLASMSHEIRTPINAILGMDEMILREAEEKPILSYAGDIMAASRTLLSLINDILDLSKVEEGKMEIIPVQYDLSSLINDLVNMIRDRAAKKGLKFEVNADEHIPHVLMGDEIRIRQCVMNLLTNAVKYTEKGQVTLSVGYEKTSDDHILLSFNVKDTGIGMKEEDMENLFSPYKRIEEKRNRTIEGTGLGMSITRQLLQLMGSNLEVHSEYGKGSEFSFAIDQEVVKWEDLGNYADRFESLAGHEGEYHELFHAPGARILVVDDTEVNLTVMKNLLKKTKIQIDTAKSGKEALVLTRDNLYDVIFIDHMMPEMDGIETLKNIRKEGASKDAPCVALTANAVSGAREMYLEAGFVDYLSKPVEGAKLEEMLRSIISADKVEVADGTEAEELEEKESSEFLQWVKELKDIDEHAGLLDCGSEDGYKSVMSVFHQTANANADAIEEYYKNGDLPNYTIKVHALKSSARIIGAKELSALALELENAGKSGDETFIKEHTDTLLAMYRNLDDKLTWFDKADENLPAISESALKDAYMTIIEAAGCMDYTMLDEVLMDLHNYALSETDAECVSEIEEKLMGLEWEEIIRIAKKRI